MKVYSQDTLPWTIIGRNLKLDRMSKMYNTYNINFKYRFIKPLLAFGIYVFSKISKRILKDVMIKPEEVNREECNKLINIATESFTQTLQESAILMSKDLKVYKDPMSAPHLKLMKDGYDIFLQTVLFDTYYRSIFEIYLLNLAINIGHAYKDDKNHVIFSGGKLDNIDYFMATQRNNKENLIFADIKGAWLCPTNTAVRLNKQHIESIIIELKKKEKVASTAK